MPTPAPTLRLPHPPTFPLSSPITEEIPSPVSSSSSIEERSRSRRNKPLEVSTTARQTPFVHTSKDAHRSQMVVADRHSSANTDADTNTNMDMNNIHGVAKRPTGLNLVTNFDSSLSVPKPVSRSKPRPRSRRRTPTFVDLNDLKSLCQTRERERSTQQKIKGILKRGRSKRAQHVPESGTDTGMKTGMGMRASVLDVQKEDHLTPSHPKKKRKSELSPSDRPIPIGFTVSHVDVDSDEDHNNLKDMQTQDDNQLTPLTPSIIVTPARDESSFWEDEEVEVDVDADEVNHPHPHSHPRPRVASSVYSQPTPLIDLDTEVPPVPAIPACHSSEKIATATPKLQQRSGVGTAPVAPVAPPPTTRNRTYSTGTVFEDDDSPRELPTSRSRSYSSGSGSGQGSRKSRATGNRKTLDRLSINTDTNRPQSQGWWTYLLSPLLTRSSTVTSGNTPTSPGPGGDVPPLPMSKRGVAESTASSEDWWEKEVEVSCFSPDTPETPYGRYPGTRDVQGTNPFVDGRGEQNTDAGAGAGAGGGVDIFAGQAIQGCAAEYYQACAHELFSGTPYFECENHVCSITPEDKKPKLEPQPQLESHPEKTTPMSGKKGLALVEMDTVQSPESEKAARAHRFSGSTAINDRNETPVYVNKGYFGTPIAATKPKRKPVGLTVTGLPGIKPDQGYGNSLDKPEQQAGTRPATPVTPFYIPPAPATPLPSMNTTVTVERAIVPPNAQHQQPDPISPAFQQATERSGIPLSNMRTHTHTHTHTEATSGHSPNTNTSLPQRPTPLPTRGLSPSSPSTPTRDRQRESSRIESRRQRHEKEEKVGKKASGLWRGRGPFSKKGCLGRDGREGRMKRRWYFAIVILFLIILIIAILLAVFLTRKANHSPTTTDDPNDDTPSTGGDDTGPIQSRWLNLTGYPPMPTGISTIAGPKPLHQESGCIQPNALWSCALPKVQQGANEPYKADEPNFRIQIRFRNGTYEHSTTVASSSSSSKRSNGGGWDAVPPAPSDKDQRFLGNTTDGNVAPFEGEETPFFITFLSTSESSSSSSSSDHTRRAFTNPDANPNPTLTRRSSTASFPNLKDIIPSPATGKNGSPAPATLYPLPSSQPVRLYNRDKEDEHYGFYTYFDRSIFLQSSAPLNGGSSDDIEGDKDGGSKMEDASVRCTWAQTRFLVQIWTGQGGGKKVLLQSSTSTSTTTSTAAQPTSTGDAESYTRPGTLPYPITLTLDRHGGAAKKKMVYCYGIDDDGAMNATALKLQLEDRAYKGSLVNEAPGVFNNTDVVAGDDGDVEGKGGVDGGDGGCGCSWGNWVSLT